MLPNAITSPACSTTYVTCCWLPQPVTQRRKDSRRGFSKPSADNSESKMSNTSFWSAACSKAAARSESALLNSFYALSSITVRRFCHVLPAFEALAKFERSHPFPSVDVALCSVVSETIYFVGFIGIVEITV
jgi:hypothetical protein